MGWSGGVHLGPLANFAHELRTPVQVLLGYLDILRGERVDAAAATLAELANRTIIERMNANVRELAQTVENVLEFVLADAALETAAEEVELAEFFDELEEVLDTLKRNGNLAIRFDLGHAPRTIVTRRRALRSIVLNLASNAIKFTSDGEVVISASLCVDDPDTLVLEVRDTGVGIDDDQLSSAFEPMVQLSQSSIRRHRGLGLGLTVVQRNVKGLGGRLWVESAPAVGSCFKVTIPCSVSSQQVCG